MIHNDHIYIGSSTFRINRNIATNDQLERRRIVNFVHNEDQDIDGSFRIWHLFNPYWEPFLNLSYYSERRESFFIWH